MKKSIKKNYIYNVIYQILSIIFPILTTPYVARVLGAEGTGIYSYTVAIASYFILFGTLGITLYGQREIAYNQNDQEKINKLFTELVVLKCITMTIAIFFFVIFFAINNEYSTYYQILILELIATAIDISWLYQGLEEFKVIVLRNIIIKVISIISIFLFVKSVNDLWIYIIIYACSVLFGNLSMWVKRKKYVSFVALNKMELKKHFKKIAIIFLPQIAIQIYTVLDKTMIGFILNDMNQVGYYEQSQKIVRILLTIITSLGTVLMPRIANCYAQGKKEKIKEYIEKSFCFLYFLSFPMIFGIMAVASSFIPIFLGNGYEEVVNILKIISIILLLIGTSNIIGNQLLLTTRKEKEYTISVTFGAIINFLLNWILIPKYQAVGATIATIVAEFSVTAIQLFFIRKEFQITKILYTSKQYLFAGIIMYLCCILVSDLNINSIGMMSLQVMVGIIVYFGSLKLLKNPFLEYVIDTIKNDIFKKKIKK